MALTQDTDLDIGNQRDLIFPEVPESLEALVEYDGVHH